MAAISPSVDPWVQIGLMLAETAGEASRRALVDVQSRARRTRGLGGRARRPGVETPLWNGLGQAVQAAVAQRGAKVRLARYLGIPKQRLTDFLRGRRRLPDAEVTLQLLNWLASKRQGGDLSL